MNTLVRYSRSDQHPAGTNLQRAARDSVIRYCRHFGYEFRWLHDQYGQWWDVTGPQGRPLRVFGWRCEVEIVGRRCICVRAGGGVDSDGCPLHDLVVCGPLIGGHQ